MKVKIVDRQERTVVCGVDIPKELVDKISRYS